MSATPDPVIEELASDYAAYPRVDMDAELKGVYEAVEEMQLRLEEFRSIAEMLQAKDDKSITENIPQLLALKPQVNQLSKRIDALDFFVTRVNLDLATLEANVEAAEASLGTSDNKLAMLNPFAFFKKSPETPTSPPPPPPQPPRIFKMEDYFKAEPEPKST
ncbi:hypothetical protein TSAR_013564 [Trichomalopsis sarcophagae]|uniref:Biogenesis of lysosome-related organelles complex 1 subunit 4 n=1 Tax=Trichomalopsis sarcophagae TaxID=543379 RepID=A0A232FIB1_9HYME|nr:hypothetical protein TSAR_013564 [Trichomalopsis sarcophagae]